MSQFIFRFRLFVIIRLLKIDDIEIQVINKIQLVVDGFGFHSVRLKFFMSGVSFMRTMDVVDIVRYVVLMIVVFLVLCLGWTTFGFLFADWFQSLVAFLIFVETLFIRLLRIINYIGSIGFLDHHTNYYITHIHYLLMF